MNRRSFLQWTGAFAIAGSLIFDGKWRVVDGQTFYPDPKTGLFELGAYRKYTNVHFYETAGR